MLRWLVATAFGVAAVAALSDDSPVQWAQSTAARAAVMLAPYVELILAVALITRVDSRWPVAGLVGLLILYSGLLLVLEHVLDVPSEKCGCFGSSLQLPLAEHLVLNGTLTAALGGLGLLESRGPHIG